MSALEFNNFTLSYPRAAEHLLGMRVSSTFLATLKVMPVLGHDFTPDDDRPNGPPVALMSYRLWKERFGSPGGKYVPEAVGLVISSGITVQSYKGFWGSLRLRAFGPRNLTSDAIYRSSSTILLNAEVGHEIGEKWRVSADFFNLLNRNDHDIDYAYESRVTPTGASVSACRDSPLKKVEPLSHSAVLRSVPIAGLRDWRRL